VAKGRLHESGAVGRLTPGQICALVLEALDAEQNEQLACVISGIATCRWPGLRWAGQEAITNP